MGRFSAPGTPHSLASQFMARSQGVMLLLLRLEILGVYVHVHHCFVQVQDWLGFCYQGQCRAGGRFFLSLGTYKGP